MEGIALQTPANTEEYAKKEMRDHFASADLSLASSASMT